MPKKSRHKQLKAKRDAEIIRLTKKEMQRRPKRRGANNSGKYRKKFCDGANESSSGLCTKKATEDIYLPGIGKIFQFCDYHAAMWHETEKVALYDFYVERQQEKKNGKD